MLKCDLKTSVRLISLLLSERRVNLPLPYSTSPPLAYVALKTEQDKLNYTECDLKKKNPGNSQPCLLWSFEAPCKCTIKESSVFSS